MTFWELQSQNEANRLSELRRRREENRILRRLAEITWACGLLRELERRPRGRGRESTADFPPRPLASVPPREESSIWLNQS